MILGGYWPHQSKWVRVAHFVFLTFVLVNQVIPQVLAITKYGDDPRIYFETVTIFFYEAICVTKAASLSWNVPKVSYIFVAIEIL